MSIEQKLSTGDRLEAVRICLSCTLPDCPGQCAKLRQAQAATRRSRAASKALGDPVLQEVVRMIRNGATDGFICRELRLTVQELSARRRQAVRAGYLIR